jgi:hypothetical protein
MSRIPAVMIATCYNLRAVINSKLNLILAVYGQHVLTEVESKVRAVRALCYEGGNRRWSTLATTTKLTRHATLSDRSFPKERIG